MKLIKTKLDRAFIIELEKSEDERGFFSNIWSKKIFQENNLNIELATQGSYCLTIKGQWCLEIGPGTEENQSETIALASFNEVSYHLFNCG